MILERLVMREIHVRKLSISVIQLDVDFMRVSCDD